MVPRIGGPVRELTYYIAVTLDGFIAGPDGQFDAFLYEGDHMAALTSPTSRDFL